MEVWVRYQQVSWKVEARVLFIPDKLNDEELADFMRRAFSHFHLLDWRIIQRPFNEIEGYSLF
jgi:hypothetical protein